MLRFYSASFALLAAALTATAVAAPGDLRLEIPHPELSSGAAFGDFANAFQGNILVGAPNMRIDGTAFVGRAYLFDGATGELLFNIPSPVVENREQFGLAVAGTSDRIAVGSSSGVYLFNSAGELQTKLTNPDPLAKNSGGFGQVIAASGDRIVVGAPSVSYRTGQNIGAAYVLNSDGELLQSIPNPDMTNGLFSIGLGVAFGGDDIIVGCFLCGPDESSSIETSVGRAWVFDGETGTVKHRIENPAPESGNTPPVGDWFGWAVSSAGDKILVGARLDDPGDVEDAGTVYAFNNETGELRLTIPNPDPEEDEYFGRSVVGVGDDILVGAWGDQRDGHRVGAAYLFDGLTGRLLFKIPNPYDSFDLFGSHVAPLGNDLLIGARNASPEGVTSAGAVYVFEGVPPYIPGDTNRDGQVDVEDLNHVRNNFGATGQGLLGDMDGNMSVDIVDLNIVRNNFGASVTAHAVPEPDALLLASSLLLTAAAMVRMRSRRTLPRRSLAATSVGSERMNR